MTDEIKKPIETESSDDGIGEILTPQIIRDFGVELKKRITDLQNMDSSETFVIQDQSRGRVLHLSSKKYDVQQLANLGLGCWDSFFNVSETKRGFGTE